MNQIEQARFNPLYQQMLQSLNPQGMRPKTIAAYSRAVRRVADYVDRCPNNLTAQELKDYFASLVVSHSWSTVKLDRNGIQFFYRHVLDKPWDWVKIVKPPQVRSLPDILTPVPMLPSRSKKCSAPSLSAGRMRYDFALHHNRRIRR